METRQLMMLERLVDSIQMTSMFDVFRYKHTVIANKIQEIYNKLFKEINTPDDVWEITNAGGFYFATLTITRNSKNKSTIIIQHDDRVRMVNFQGPLFTDDPKLNSKGSGRFLYLVDFTKIIPIDQETYLREAIGLPPHFPNA
jgi:hypothetical protein